MPTLTSRRGWKPPERKGFSITVEGVSKSFDKTRALIDVNMKVPRGSMFGLIGPNGAGKSTLMKSLIGSVHPDSGRIRVMGMNPTMEDLRIKAFSGIVPEAEMPPSFLTPEEYLDFSMHVRGLEPSSERRDHWLAFFDMEEQSDVISRDLSKGTRQKLMLASAFIHDPPLLLLDEPFINLDPIYQRKVKDWMRSYTGRGGTILISTHILALAEEICDRVTVLHKGSLIRTGRTDEIMEGSDLESVFLKMVGYVEG